MIDYQRWRGYEVEVLRVVWGSMIKKKLQEKTEWALLVGPYGELTSGSVRLRA